MPTTVVEIYRELPGASAHPVWDQFAEEGAGLYLIGGSSYTGKSEFAEKTAVQAAIYLKVKPKELIYIDFSGRKDAHPNYLSYVNDPVKARSSAVDKQQAKDQYVSQVLADVQAKNIRMAVVDEIRSPLHAEIVVRLWQSGVLVFAVFRSGEKNTIFDRFSTYLSNGNDDGTVDERAHLAFLSLVYTQSKDCIRREGFVEYSEGKIKVPTSMV